MPQPELGRLEPRGLRDIWAHEERDFTPWLAVNIDQLSALLNVPIVVDQIEHRVGAYELDILGHVGETDNVVIIENQLSTSDHTHLGQLITYAAGLDARIVVWLVAEVRDEHRAAVEWLNSHTGNAVSFFLVRPEAFSIDGSKPAVRLTLEATPSEFSRQLRQLVEQEDAPRHEFRRRFWDALFEHLAQHGHPWAKGRTGGKDNWISSAVGKSGINCNVSMAHGSRMRVEIYLSSEEAKRHYDHLLAKRDEIEAQFPNDAVSWERLEDAVAARIAVYRPYDKTAATEDTQHRMELFDWIARSLKTLRHVARKHLVEATNGPTTA